MGEANCACVGFPNDGDAGDRRVRPISRSIFSRRSIAFCALLALVARRSSAIASAAAASISSTHSSAFSASVPTPRSVTGSRACSRRSSVRRGGASASGVTSGVASGTRSKVDVAAAATAAPSGCDRTSPPSVASAWGSAARAHASLHPGLPLSRSLAPGAENATSSRYPVTDRSAPIASAFDFSLAPDASRGIPSTTNAQHLSSNPSVSAPGNPDARPSRSLSLPQDVATCFASASTASGSVTASLGRTLARVAAAAPSFVPPGLVPAPPAPLVSSASFPRKTSTCLATSASAEGAPLGLGSGFRLNPEPWDNPARDGCLPELPSAPRENDRVRPPGGSDVDVDPPPRTTPSSFSAASAASAASDSFSSAMIVSSVSSRSTSRSSSFPVSFAAGASSPQPNSLPASARRAGSARARSMARRFSFSSAAARSSRMRTPAVSLGDVAGLAAKDPAPDSPESTGTSESNASNPRRSRSSAQTA